MAQVSLHPKPGAALQPQEFMVGGKQAMSVVIDGAPVIITGGDAAIVAMAGEIIDVFDALRRQAIERLAQSWRDEIAQHPSFEAISESELRALAGDR